MVIPEGKQRERNKKEIKIIMTKNLHKSQIQEAQRILSRMNAKKIPVPIHIIFKLQKNKEKILKAAGVGEGGYLT